MRQKGQKKENRILKCVVVGGVLIVAFMTALAGRYLCLSDRENTINLEESAKAQEEELVKEAGAVKVQEAQFSNSFSNTSDGKKAIRIVEVIPHEICSVFPYLIDWKDVKTYNEKTFIGYEGLRYLTIQSDQKYQYSLTKNGITRDFLDDYNVTFIAEGNWTGTTGIWRQTKSDPEYDIRDVNGYFEYVGNHKGLYNINLNYLVKEGSSDLGIRYDIMAMKRKGNEAKKGEWEVKNARYYWAKDYAGSTNYPTAEVRQHTGYNYNLKFQTGESGENPAEYRIHSISANVEGNTTQGSGFEYVAVLAPGVDWSNGYVYRDQGNYSVSSATAHLVNESTDLSGKYVRITSDSKDDGNGLGKGYFRLCNSEDNIRVGDTVYSVTFAPVSLGEKGNYVLNPAAVQSAINQDKSQALTDILFEYVGAGKGNYDIVFIYGTDSGVGAAYSCTLLDVSNGDGRYALTSTEADEDDLYEKVDSGNGDYSKVVTSIDCAGIDYTEFWKGPYERIDAQKGCYNANLPGLTMGQDEYAGIYTTVEYGDWVFHTVNSDELNGITKIEELEGGSVPANKRIYVYGQNRKNRCYAQNGFENNEWFKLLMYLSTEDGSEPLAYQDYAEGKLTPLEIKEKYAKDIEAFDRAYRIEIIQRTPGELTVDDVKKADLLYFGTTIGLPGMTANLWNTIRENYDRGLSYCDTDSTKYTSDLSSDTLMAIYDNCLYERTTSLLFSAGDFGIYVSDGRNITSNLGKMALLANLFDDPTHFAHFIEGYPDKLDEYSTIHTDNADVSVYEQNVAGVGTLYNLGTKVISGNNKDEEISPYRTNAWYKDYFRVVELIKDENGNYTLDSRYNDGNGKYGYNWTAHGWGNFSGEDVSEEDRTWYLPFLTTDIFGGYGNTRNVWKILRNKKSKETSEPVIVVTNADGDNISELESVIPVYYYYVDAFALGGSNTDFDIEFRVNWRPEEISDPNALVSVTIARSDGTVIFNPAGPAYKTDYTHNVASDFVIDGAFDPSINSKEYEITATDAAGKTDSVIVRFIVRDSFMLN